MPYTKKDAEKDLKYLSGTICRYDQYKRGRKDPSVNYGTSFVTERLLIWLTEREMARTWRNKKS